MANIKKKVDEESTSTNKKGITKVNTTVPADASIPDLNRLPDWHLTHLSEEKHWKNLSYRFSVYKKTYSNPCTKT